MIRWRPIVSLSCIGLLGACQVSPGGRTDAGAGSIDAGAPDAGASDAGLGDAGLGDAGLGDAGLGDAGLGDAGLGDAGLGDAGLADAGSPFDAGPEPDAGTCSCDIFSGCSGPANDESSCPTGTICSLGGVCVLPSYTVNDNGTVTDHVTGLTWEQVAPSDPCPRENEGNTCSITDAATYCQSLNLGGASGWRVPTLAELFSLVDLGGNPTVASDTFQNLSGSYFSSTGYLYNGDTAWCVDFDYANDGACSSNPPSASILCVRGTDEGVADAGVGDDAGSGGETDAGEITDGGLCGCTPSSINGCGGPMDAGYGLSLCPTGTVCDSTDFYDGGVPPGTCMTPRYGVNGDGTVTDEATGLVWQQDVPTAPCPADETTVPGYGICTFSDAQSYCAHLSLGGFASGWRLPTQPEADSLVEPGQVPLIDEAVFPNTPPTWFWTSSLYDGDPVLADFAYGSFGPTITIEDETYFVRCVR